MSTQTKQNPTVVLVHAAWGDAAPDTVVKLIVAALDGTHKSAFASVSKERA